MSNDLFTNKVATQNTTTDVDYVKAMSEKYAKDGKLDVEGLAKGAYHANEHIKTVEAEMAELRRELDTRISLQEFLDKQKQQQPTPVVSSPAPTSQNQNEIKGNEPTPLNKDDIAKYVKSAIDQERTAITREQNSTYVVNELIKAYGNNYIDRLNKVSNDLGLGKDFLNNLAAEQPKAFLKLVADSTPAASPSVGSFIPPRSVVNTTPSAQKTGVVKNWAYFQGLKKSDPRSYFSSSTQSELHREALKQGDAFYN